MWGKTQRHIRGSGASSCPDLASLSHASHTPRLGQERLPLWARLAVPFSGVSFRSFQRAFLCCAVLFGTVTPPLGARKGQGLGLPSLPPSSQGLLTLGLQECLVENKLADGQTGRWTTSRDRATQSEVKATSLESPGIWTDNALESAERIAQLPGHWRQNGFVAENTGRGPTLGGRQGDTCNSKRKHQPPREVRPPRGSSG